MKILGVYSIDYHNGITQIKNLISHQDYLDIIKANTLQIATLELEMNKKNKPETLVIISKLKSEIKKNFGDEWFTDESPLFKSSQNGNILELPYSQGGNSKCTITLLI